MYKRQIIQKAMHCNTDAKKSGAAKKTYINFLTKVHANAIFLQSLFHAQNITAKKCISYDTNQVNFKINLRSKSHHRYNRIRSGLDDNDLEELAYS